MYTYLIDEIKIGLFPVGFVSVARCLVENVWHLCTRSILWIYECSDLVSCCRLHYYVKCDARKRHLSSFLVYRHLHWLPGPSSHP